ncbi:MAG: VWA domain-containing protein [Deltaproteobacteria bacterium]|nr:VWA domain-containing protein [Deltaproteobacteria bacterium]
MGNSAVLSKGLVVAVAALGAMVVTCGDSDETTTSTGTGGSGATTSSSGQGGDGGFTSLTCDPPCEPPQFCGVTGVCLDDGDCIEDGDCPPGEECEDTGQCSGCEPPNMLIDLDRSCSMTGDVDGATKWEISVAAIEALTTDYAGTIRFGLTLFPDTANPDCQQDAIPIVVGEGNEAAIQTLLTDSLVNSDPNFPNGPCVTNIDTAMEQAATEPSFDDTDRESYVLLITDGKQYGCSAAGGDSGTTQIITDLYQNRGIATFVVGFGNGVDPAQLNIFAEAGGVPTNDATCTPDPCKFYKAEDAASLDAALDAIATAVNCDPGIQ